MSASNASSRKTAKIWLSIAVPSSRRMAICAGLLCFLYVAVTEGALATSDARSVDFRDKSFAGHQAGPVIMGNPCLHGKSQHYKINAGGVNCELKITRPADASEPLVH